MSQKNAGHSEHFIKTINDGKTKGKQKGRELFNSIFVQTESFLEKNKESSRERLSARSFLSHQGFSMDETIRRVIVQNKARKLQHPGAGLAAEALLVEDRVVDDHSLCQIHPLATTRARVDLGAAKLGRQRRH